MKIIRFVAPVFLVFYIVFLSIFSLLSAEEISFGPTFWSWGFVATVGALISMRLLSGVSSTSLYSLHFYTFSLFIGGRFFAFLLNEKENPFNMDFFANYSLNSSSANQLMIFVLGGMVAMELGFYLSAPWRVENNERELRSPEINEKLLSIAFWVLVPLVTTVLYQSLMSIRSHGYLGLYMGQNAEVSGGLKSIVNTLTCALLGLSFAYAGRGVKSVYMLLYFAIVTANFLYGVRGGLVTFFLFSLWIYGDLGQRKIKFGKVLMGFIAIGVFLVYCFAMFSIRGEMSAGQGIFDLFHSLFYEQGVTLMVFDMSTKVENYPWIPFFQNFIPGVSVVTNLFVDVGPHETGFSKYLSYYNNRNWFDDGYGLGWSLLSDFYVYSRGNFVAFSILAGIWGYGLSAVERVARRSRKIRALLIAVTPAIIFLPRSGLNTVFPLVIYSMFIFFCLKRISSVGRFRYRHRVPDATSDQTDSHSVNLVGKSS